MTTKIQKHFKAIAKLLREGVKVDDIVSVLGVSRTIVCQVKSQLELTPTPRKTQVEIAAMEKLERKTLFWTFLSAGRGLAESIREAGLISKEEAKEFYEQWKKIPGGWRNRQDYNDGAARTTAHAQAPRNIRRRTGRIQSEWP